MGDLGSIPGSGRPPGEGNGYPLPYSGLENSMDCICIAHGVAKSWIRLSDFHLHTVPNHAFLESTVVIGVITFLRHGVHCIFFFLSPT